MHTLRFLSACLAIIINMMALPGLPFLSGSLVALCQNPADARSNAQLQPESNAQLLTGSIINLTLRSDTNLEPGAIVHQRMDSTMVHFPVLFSEQMTVDGHPDAGTVISVPTGIYRIAPDMQHHEFLFAPEGVDIMDIVAVTPAADVYVRSRPSGGGPASLLRSSGQSWTVLSVPDNNIETINRWWMESDTLFALNPDGIHRYESADDQWNRIVVLPEALRMLSVARHPDKGWFGLSDSRFVYGHQEGVWNRLSPGLDIASCILSADDIAWTGDILQVATCRRLFGITPDGDIQSEMETRFQYRMRQHPITKELFFQDFDRVLYFDGEVWQDLPSLWYLAIWHPSSHFEDGWMILPYIEGNGVAGWSADKRNIRRLRQGALEMDDDLSRRLPLMNAAYRNAFTDAEGALWISNEFYGLTVGYIMPGPGSWVRLSADGWETSERFNAPDEFDRSTFHADVLSAMATDPEGTLWANTAYGLFRVDRDTIAAWPSVRRNRIEEEDSYPVPPTLSSMTVDHLGQVWYTSGGDLFRFDGHRFFEEKPLGDRDYAQVVSNHDQQVVWLAYDGQEQAMLDPATGELDEYPSGMTTKLQVYQGETYAVAENSVLHFSQDESGWTVLYQAPEDVKIMRAAIRSASVFYLLVEVKPQEPDNRSSYQVWRRAGPDIDVISTLDNADRNRFFWQPEEALLHLDPQGNLWVGDYHGITLFGDPASIGGSLFNEDFQLITTARQETQFENSVPPASFKLHGNYPNPFNPQTHIHFDLNRQEHVRIQVFDVLGNRVATLVDRTLSPGEHRIPFDAGRLSSGVYIYMIRAGDYSTGGAMMLVK